MWNMIPTSPLLNFMQPIFWKNKISVPDVELAPIFTSGMIIYISFGTRETSATPKRYSWSKSFFFRRKTSPRAPLFRQPPIPPLDILQNFKIVDSTLKMWRRQNIFETQATRKSNINGTPLAFKRNISVSFEDKSKVEVSTLTEGRMANFAVDIFHPPRTNFELPRMSAIVVQTFLHARDPRTFPPKKKKLIPVIPTKNAFSIDFHVFRSLFLYEWLHFTIRVFRKFFSL